MTKIKQAVEYRIVGRAVARANSPTVITWYAGVPAVEPGASTRTFG